MPIEFTQYPSPENTGVSGDTLYKMAMAYDGSGRRISKTRWVKAQGDAGWSRRHVTHYTGIGTEVRENFAGESPETKVVVNMPEGLGRYGIEDADHVAENGSAQAFEWYLKNHLGSTMVVYGTGFPDPLGISPEGELRAAYDYRSFGEQLDLLVFTRKVTENFTGKEKDDETQLDYFGARYLDPMLGMWTSVDPARQFASPYLYAGNGYNPVNIVDPDGNDAMVVVTGVADSKRYKAWSGAYTRNYEFNRYRVDVYLNTEKWKPGQTYKDVEPSKSYWGTRDAWHPEAQYNKAVISGSGYVRHTKGDKGKAKNPPWLVIGNVGYAKFKGEGPKGETTWEGESLHDGAGPANSSACVTFTREDWLSIRADLVPDIDAGNPVKIEFEPFTPEEKSW